MSLFSIGAAHSLQGRMTKVLRSKRLNDLKKEARFHQEAGLRQKLIAECCQLNFYFAAASAAS
nr:hypothetical protein [uncultured bacterium]